MADDWCNNSAGNDIVELEAMRKDSFSWHPCQVSLCSRESGLVVLYGNNNLEEIITDKEEVLARIRIRSTPLQGDDCSSVRQGELVIATKSSRVKGAFYDARVEEAIHVRHSKRIYCRCSFRIKWLHQAFDEEASTVSSSSIMKLAKKSIHLHPTISTFFSMLDSSNSLHTTPCSMIVDELHPEMDINVLLEKQIKEISNSTDFSEEMISPGFVFKQEVGFKEQCHAKMIDASLNDPHVGIPWKLNGSENKLPTETTVKIPPVCISSIEGEFTGSRFLSPLAARAALASLRSEFPQSPHFSAQSDVQKGGITGSFCAVDCASNTEGFSLNISAAFEGKSPEFKSIVKRLFPTSTASQKIESEMDKDKKTGEKNITQPSKPRFTRSQAWKGNGMEKASQMTDTIETRRVTRSTVDGAKKIDVKEYNVASTDDEQTVSAQKLDGETSECSKSLFQKDVVVVKVDIQKGTFTRNAQQNYPKRLTRSAAREETEKNNVQPKRKLRNRELDLYKGNDTPKSSENGVGNHRSTRGSSKKQDTGSSNGIRFPK